MIDLNPGRKRGPGLWSILLAVARIQLGAMAGEHIHQYVGEIVE